MVFFWQLLAHWQIVDNLFFVWQIIHNTVTKTVTDTLVKPTDMPEMRNKSVMTKPFMMTKGVSCRPHPCHKGTQTDGPRYDYQLAPHLLCLLHVLHNIRFAFC